MLGQCVNRSWRLHRIPTVPVLMINHPFSDFRQGGSFVTHVLHTCRISNVKLRVKCDGQKSNAFVNITFRRVGSVTTCENSHTPSPPVFSQDRRARERHQNRGCFNERAREGVVTFFSSGIALARVLASLESFSNDDDDGNENVKKAIGLNNQNNNSARAWHFLVHFFVVTARLGRGICRWHVL